MDLTKVRTYGLNAHTCKLNLFQDLTQWTRCFSCTNRLTAAGGALLTEQGPSLGLVSDREPSVLW